MNSNERELAALFLDILNGCSEAAILTAHPVFCSSRTNRLAINTCISCRAAAIETVTAYGGTEDDYLAMKFVLACQSLFLIHLQAAVVRSQLSALGAFLRTRAWLAADDCRIGHSWLGLTWPSAGAGGRLAARRASAQGVSPRPRGRPRSPPAPRNASAGARGFRGPPSARPFP